MSGPRSTEADAAGQHVAVSVLLPFRDVERTLGGAIESVLSERDVPLELVLCDDGSTDASRDVARAFVARDPRARLLEGERRGLVPALWRGLEVCRAPFVARMDGDDVSLPGRLGAQLVRLSGEPRVAALGGRVELFGDGAVGAGLERYVAWMNELVSPEDHARDRFVEAPLCHPSVMIRRAALDAVGGYRAGDFAEDWDLWLRLVAAGWSLAKVEHEVLRWRHRAGRATFADPRYSMERHRALRARHLAPLLERERARGRGLAVWGAGPTGRRLARALEVHGVRADRFVDIDPRKIGRVARGAPIVGVGALAGGDFVVVAVGSRTAREEVRAELVRRGRSELADFVCAA